MSLMSAGHTEAARALHDALGLSGQRVIKFVLEVDSKGPVILYVKRFVTVENVTALTTAIKGMEVIDVEQLSVDSFGKVDYVLPSEVKK